MVEDAKSKGAQVVVGGSPAPNHGSLYYNPTILTNIKDNMEIFRDEVFGPVVPFIKFTEENVILFFLHIVFGGNFLYSVIFTRKVLLES